MEYDDSNFGSQNPQINSEEIAKSSPDLGSYSLPKFDFDDSLQGDIRFDSLVETEAFLGIESQEDTSWIEDFSRGSNRINFSSQAAESASISRRNNVWSEAASLESVEMLLKAVGQEDTIPGDNEIQDCGAGDELGSSTLQLKQNEEDKDHLNANNVCPCAAIPRDEISHKFLSDDASELQHEEDVQSVPGKLCDSGNNVDFLLQEPDVEIVRCSVTIDTQALSAADNTSMDQKHELNLIKADTTSEIALLEGIQTPLSQADCHFPQTTSSFTESLSSRLQQENDTSKNLSRILQITGVRDLSEGPVMANVEEVDQTVMGKYMQQSEECSARSVAGDSEKYVTLDLYSTPEGEPGAVGTVNDHLKELFRSSTKGDHDFHLIEVCLRKSDASNPTEDCKCESDSPANVYEGSNATLEGGPVTGNPITCSCCNGKIHSDAPVIGSAVVQKKDELCGSTERDNKSVEAMARDDEICGARVELEDDLIGCAEQMDNAVALKKPENSQIENDEIMGIPSVETDNKLANDGSSLREVCSSTVLASVTPATEDLSVSITPAVSEEHIIRINISSSTTVEGATQETTADFDLGDGNDKCMDTVVNMQYSIISNVADRTCNTVRLLANDIIRDPPLESLCNTENQGTPCESPSAVPAANGRDSEEFKVSPPDVYCCSETCKDAEAEDSMHDHLGKSGTPCSYDGTSTHDGSTSQDPKVCDASDNDKTFSFVVASSAEHSETENVKLWQPFASQVPINSQIVKDSRLTPGMEQISSSNIGSHQTMGEEVIMGSRSTADRKPRRAAGKTNKKEGAKREGRQKPTAHSNLKESSIFPTVEPSFPDLNHASSSPTVHQQHFTNLQQLQLRAQIFVYGSLIQGTPPDEACMVAAFGGPDGGRSIWENARRCCLERIQGQKSQHSYLETPLQQHSSPRNTNQKGNTRKSRNKNNAPTPSKASKSTPTSTISHLAPASSPLWTIQTPANLAHFSGMAIGSALDHNVHSQFYSSSPMTSTAVRTPSWSPHLVPWVASPQTTTNATSLLTTMPLKMDPVKLTSIRESSISEISVMHASPGPMADPGGHTSGAKSPLINFRTSNLNPNQNPTDSKPRKRNKIELDKASMVVEQLFNVEPVSDACVSSILPASTVATPRCETKSMTSASSFSNYCASSDVLAMKGSGNIDNRIMMSEDMLSKIDEAKLHAEDAAACAVAAVDLSQEMWCQLAKQKDSGTIPDIEAKISSAALAIAAAVAVAKAAAAAGKVASDAAIQAKLMAEEAMDSSRMSFVDSSTKVLFATTVNNFENSIPSSILKGDIQMDSSSSFAARLNAQDVASKRAENMDAIVKAAELAAKAVTQAGKVAVMGDPLQLSELASAGPEGCWKLAKLSFERESQSNTVIEPHVVDTNKGGNISETVQKTLDIPMEMSGDHFEDEREPSSVVLVSKVRKAPGTAEAIPIKEGSSVEIFKEGDAIKAAWFSAYVLELKNGEAYVCYTENFPTGSSGELKEWIRLDSQNEAPKIRPAHPMSAMPTEGTRKRRREPMGKCFWSIGDRVDAWRQNCWWEGVISEKIRKDDTSFTVHFPAQRETSTIKACHLRPSLFWLDGEWVEWCNSMSYDGDMRQEKRMKFYDTEHEIKRNDKESDKLDTTESEMRADSRLVGLSNNEKAFDVGKSCRDDKRPVTHRMARSGLQNEGKKVTFGVPRSGKKRKFMDVSQHYVSRDSKMHEKNDSTRRAKMLMPQGSGLPVWKSSTRIDVREKQMPATQLRVPNSRKLTGVQDRTLEKNSISSAVSRNDNTFKSEGMTGFASFSSIGKARRAPFGFSSSSDEHSVKRRFTSTSSKSELASKSKLELPFQKLGKIEEDKVYSRTVSVSISEGAEPRRSSRRMQPTSRLLEGLQTSLTIPKLQAVSRDKGQKSHNTSASLRGKQCN
uniref:Agenet domain-containing protein n=1 Tax=Kalanchoe fedtschenkoi TaxID=63787 RepID=A0A7N0RBB3_KALFE